MAAYKPKVKTVNLMFIQGGVGDGIAALSAVEYIVKRYTWIRPLLWTQDFMVDLARHLISKRCIVRGYSEMPEHYDRNLPTKTTTWDGAISPMKIHLLDYAFLKLCDEAPGIEHKNYLQIRPDEIDVSRLSLPKDYVVVTTGHTAIVREFRPEEVNKIIGFLLERRITPVFLGSTSTKTGGKHVIKGRFDRSIHFDKGLDLIDKTTLLESAKVMHGAKAVIGVDNGLMHLAGCTGTPIVEGFTTVSPEARWPVRNNILGWKCWPVEPEAKCRYCQVNTNFLYDHDYTKCLHDVKSEEYLVCTREIRADKFIAALKEIL